MELNIIQYQGNLGRLVKKAVSGKKEDIDCIMEKLNPGATLVMTRNIDFAISLVKDPEGIKRLEYYLFNGSQIQRNYVSLYFNRLDEWKIVKKAYKMGLIDEEQAYCR